MSKVNVNQKNLEILQAFAVSNNLSLAEALKLNRYGYLFDDLIKPGRADLSQIDFDDQENYRYRKELLSLIPKNLLSEPKAKLKKDVKPALLLNLSRVNASFNGTAKYAISLVNQFVKDYSSNFKISLLIGQGAWSAHQEEFKLNQLKLNPVEVLHPEEEPSWSEKIFDISLSISQFMELNDLAIVARHSRKLTFILLDYIGIKATYIDRMIVGRGGYSPFKLNLLALQFADNITSISKSSLEDIRSYSKGLVSAANFYKQPIQLSAPDITKKEPQPKSKLNSERNTTKVAISHFIANNPDFAFIMGNGFYHKAVQESALKLKQAKLEFIQMHSDLKLAEDGLSLTIPSGTVAEDDLNKIYQKAIFVIFPSVYEGLGLPILEAVQHHKIVLAIDNNLNRELIEQYKLDPRQIILFKDFKSLPKALKKAQQLTLDLKNPELKFKVPSDLTDWQRPAKQAFQFINDTLAQKPDSNFEYSRALTLNLMEDLFNKTTQQQDQIAQLSLDLTNLKVEYQQLQAESSISKVIRSTKRRLSRLKK